MMRVIDIDEGFIYFGFSLKEMFEFTRELSRISTCTQNSPKLHLKWVETPKNSGVPFVLEAKDFPGEKKGIIGWIVPAYRFGGLVIGR